MTLLGIRHLLGIVFMKLYQFQDAWLRNDKFPVIRYCLLVFVLGVVLGCADSRPTRVPVSGKVILDGEPLPNCTLQFSSSKGRSSFGVTDEAGKFTLGCYEDADGVLPGKHRVVVVAKKEIDGNTIQWNAPKKYLDYTTSGLEYTIDEPTEDLVIDLTWAGDKPFVERNGVRQNN